MNFTFMSQKRQFGRYFGVFVISHTVWCLCKKLRVQRRAEKWKGRRRMMSRNILGKLGNWTGGVALVFAWLAMGLGAHAATIFVDSQATSSGLGSSWSDALPNITQGLASAQVGDQVWVAQGTYYEFIHMKSGVAVFGGFDKTEATINERDWRTHASIIDASTVNNGYPTSHAVVMDGVWRVRLDGFVITGGEATAYSAPSYYYMNIGGGIFCKNIDASVTIAHCLIRNNKAISGAGLAITSTQTKNVTLPMIQDCHFCDNIALSGGGGVYAYKLMENSFAHDVESLTLDDSTFYNNTGCAVVLSGLVAQINRCRFVGNGLANHSAVCCEGIDRSLQAELRINRSIMVETKQLNVIYSTAEPHLSNNVIAHSAGTALEIGPYDTSQSFYNAYLYNNLFLSNNIAFNVSSSLVQKDFYLYNNMFSQNGCALYYEREGLPLGHLENNLFHGNAVDVYDAASGPHQGAQELMDWYTDQHASNLLDEDPQFASSQPLYVSSQPVFDALAYRTTFYDTSRVMTPGSLRDKVVKVNDEFALIEDNTTSQVTVLGDVRDLLSSVFEGDVQTIPCLVLDYHVLPGSPAVDSGRGGEEIPSSDLDGYPRPVDVAGEGADGSGTEYDLGPYELQPTSQAPYVLLSASELDFGEWAVETGPSPARSVFLTNGGTDEDLVFTTGGLTIGGADGDQFAFVGQVDMSALPPGASRTIRITFNPSTKGSKTAWVEISTNNSNQPLVRLDLSGRSPAPLAPVSVGISPAGPGTLDDISPVPVVEYSEPIMAYEVVWKQYTFSNSDEVTTSSELHLSHTLTERGQEWFGLIRVQDIYGFWSPWADIPRFTIENSPPTQPFVKILPDPAQAGEDLIVDIQVYSIDPDGDEVAYDFDWFKSTDNGQTWIHKVELDGSSQVSGLYINEGELWQVHYTPYEKASATTSLSKDGVHKTDDGRIEGRFGWDQVYVGNNHAPTFATLLYGLAQEDALVRLCTTWDAQDRDGDAVSVNLYWLDSICSQIGTVGEGMGAAYSLRLHPLAEVDPELYGAVRLYYVALDSRGAVRQFLSDPMPLSQAITHLSLSDYLLGKCEPGNEQILDFNGDGLVDVCDVVKLVNE